MTDAESRILHALARMVMQYLETDDRLDNLSMSAGEEALEVLAEYGLVEMVNEGRRLGRWTEKGHAFLWSR